jgi:hypothetical protein
MAFRAPLFFLTGLVWLLLSAAVGLALFLGIVLGHPLPSFLRLLHVHGALVGGVAQLILGALLAFIPALQMSGRNRPESHPILYVFINAGAFGMLMGFGVGEPKLVGASGIFVILTFLALSGDAIWYGRRSLVSPPLSLWFYGLAILALLVGLVAGESMAFRLISPARLEQIRLSHIHLNLLGFMTLTIIGTMHTLFPTILNARLHSARLAYLTFFLLPVGIVGLVAGFLLSQVWVQLASGLIVLAGVALYASNIVGTWLEAGRPSHVAAEHLLVATFFLILAVVGGLLVTVNHLSDPPAVPFGTLHLVAYTHLALIGFVFQTIVGALSHLLPILLAVRRVKSNKKRGPYLARLTALMERWRPIQVGTLSLGTMGLGLVAALVWQVPMTGLVVQATSWISAALLLVGIGVFAVKVALAVGSQPEP